MDFEFHPDQWITIFRNNPVLIVLLAGMIAGTALTQTAKLVYLAFPDVLGGTVTEPRYNLTITLLATLLTFAFTDWLWIAIIRDNGTGLRHAVSLVSAVACPYTYKGVKSLVAWQWPAFAAKWGDNGKP